MKLAVISFTENGIRLSKTIGEIAGHGQCRLFTKCSAYSGEDPEVRFVEEGVGEWVREQFEEENAVVFIGACGIAVRAAAPYIRDKLCDSPVLVMDEKGQYVIPILSGHVGGANRLAVFLAGEIGAQAVITTATDINRKFAVDVFAEKNGLSIMNKDGIAKVSSKVLAGERITLSAEPGHMDKGCGLPECIRLTEYPPVGQADVVITSESREVKGAVVLRPREYILGFGCRKGKEAEKIGVFIAENLEKAGISLMQVGGLASIDVKKDEPGLVAWCRRERIPFMTYGAEELRGLDGDFRKSRFVEQQVGVDNVCERAALKACGPGGSLIYGKHCRDGMTIAVAKRKWSVSFDEK